MLLLLLRVYKLAISPFLGSNCRFYPSCSEYAFEAIQRYGAWKGGYLAAHRLCRCHPFSQGGVDPVPMPHSPNEQHSSATRQQRVIVKLPRP
jgi:uncharacterized protein